MCVGIMPILSLALGAMQGVMSYSAQKQAANDQNAYYMANARAAQQAAVNSYAAEQNQAIQKRNAASQQEMETRISGMQARGTARTAAGESGVSGLSVDALVNDDYGREGRRIDSIDQNYAMDRDYLRAQMESTEAQATSRINSVQRARGPSFGDAMLPIAGSRPLHHGLLQQGLGRLRQWHEHELRNINGTVVSGSGSSDSGARAAQSSAASRRHLRCPGKARSEQPRAAC
jgi:hypothetical protein